MLSDAQIERCRQLYEIIFSEDANSSKEFITFVNEISPHPLRIKVEEYAYTHMYDVGNKFQEDSLLELDTLITNYIEDNEPQRNIWTTSVI